MGQNALGVVHDAIEDGIGDGQLTQIRVPLIAGQLARDDRRASGVAILQHFEEILTLDVAQGRCARCEWMRRGGGNSVPQWKWPELRLSCT